MISLVDPEVFKFIQYQNMADLKIEASTIIAWYKESNTGYACKATETAMKKDQTGLISFTHPSLSLIFPMTYFSQNLKIIRSTPFAAKFFMQAKTYSGKTAYKEVCAIMKLLKLNQPTFSLDYNMNPVVQPVIDLRTYFSGSTAECKIIYEIE